MNKLRICELFVENEKIDPVTNKKLKYKSKKYWYYVKLCTDHNYYFENKKVWIEVDKITPCFSKIKDIDIKILSYINDNILIQLCLVNKYTKSICHNIWREKITQLYPTIPLSKYHNISNLYINSPTYTDLKKISIRFKYQKILNWLNNPLREINLIVEDVLDKAKYLSNVESLRNDYKKYHELDEYYENEYNEYFEDFYYERRSQEYCDLDKNQVDETCKLYQVGLYDIENYLCNKIYPSQQLICKIYKLYMGRYHNKIMKLFEKYNICTNIK